MKYVFPERLKELREEKELSVNQLAKEINVSPTAISRWENNLRIPNIVNFFMLADFLTYLPTI